MFLNLNKNIKVVWLSKPDHAKNESLRINRVKAKSFYQCSSLSCEFNTLFSLFQTLFLLHRHKSLLFLQLASLHQFFVLVHLSVSLRVSCVMVEKTALMDLMKTTVWSSAKAQVCCTSSCFLLNSLRLTSMATSKIIKV